MSLTKRITLTSIEHSGGAKDDNERWMEKEKGPGITEREDWGKNSDA